MGKDAMERDRKGIPNPGSRWPSNAELEEDMLSTPLLKPWVGLSLVGVLNATTVHDQPSFACRK